MLRTVRIFVCVFALSCLALLGASPASRRGADVHLTFSGLICHIFDAGHEPRSVTMRGTEAMPHRATLYLQEDEVESSEVLLTCDGTEHARPGEYRPPLRQRR